MPNEECVGTAHLPFPGLEPVPLKTTKVCDLRCDARPAVTFLVEGYHFRAAGIKLYCFVTEAHHCEQLAQCRYLKTERPVFNTLTITPPGFTKNYLDH